MRGEAQGEAAIGNGLMALVAFFLVLAALMLVVEGVGAFRRNLAKGSAGAGAANI